MASIKASLALRRSAKGEKTTYSSRCLTPLPNMFLGKMMDLNQVAVQSINILASIKFYERLGLMLIVEDEHYARFEFPKGNSTLSVHHATESKLSNTVIYFEVSDVVKTVSELKAKGVIFTQDPKEEPWLWYESRLQDPSGNEVCIYSAGENRKNPPWRLSRT
ncbi:MAG: VOC family protein [Porticoccaceae bacterium]|nr:VOC family protein [Porticoccaceae bacterium]